uniref:hemagglutinin/amebocyte aggregation factor-like isoform X2 n=1 Tax=Myxine glutinosa TaxID=7769 RepID=UPI00358E43AC
MGSDCIWDNCPSGSRLDRTFSILSETRSNDPKGPMYVLCPYIQTISSIQSTYMEEEGDRLWEVSCKDTYSYKHIMSCYTTPHVNCFKESTTFICPFNSIISGMQSYFSESAKDRRWRFTCCHQVYFCLQDCVWTAYKNNPEKAFKYNLQKDMYLSGLKSYYDKATKDRRWKFMLCKKRSC